MTGWYIFQGWNLHSNYSCSSFFNLDFESVFLLLLRIIRSPFLYMSVFYLGKCLHYAYSNQFTVCQSVIYISTSTLWSFCVLSFICPLLLSKKESFFSVLWISLNCFIFIFVYSFAKEIFLSNKNTVMLDSSSLVFGIPSERRGSWHSSTSYHF